MVSNKNHSHYALLFHRHVLPWIKADSFRYFSLFLQDVNHAMTNEWAHLK